MKKVVIALLSSVLLLGCARDQQEEKAIVIEADGNEMTPYTQIAVKRGTIKSEVNINCQYAPKEKITCAFTGQEREIAEVLVEKGDFVKKGQILARQNIEEYEELIFEEQHAIEMANLSIVHLTEMKQVELDLMEKAYEFQDEDTRDGESYRLNREKTVKNYDEQIVDYQDAVAIHTMRLEEYRKKIEEGILRAPASGVITISHTDLAGSISKPSENVITMISNDALVFSSSDIEKQQFLEDGRTYSVLVGKGESQKIIEVVPVAFQETDEKLFFEIKTPDLKLETGAQGIIWITLEEKENALYLPSNVIHTSGDKKYVYTLSQEGVRDICYVTTGINDRENTEIVNGLEEGDYVLQE
ncbi:MAG: efflux RND transporter periplasmic adaptor subunit [Lachnospiraceae bacterium]|nr:efflux RND transporter periplasmic adaptor subunit [Lachnospiraceae bacterium]